MLFPFIDLIEFAGTFAFAISGIRMAALKRFDWFGAYVVGLVTAIGGGTIRDVLLNTTPFWMQNSSYLIVTGITLIFVIMFNKHLMRFNNAFFIFDTIGLGLFVVVGLEKSLQFGFPYWVAILMGSITGAAGGVLRDVLLREVPLIFQKEIYAIACIIGGLVYYLLDVLGVSNVITQVSVVCCIILIRIVAVRFEIGLPILNYDEKNKKDKSE